MPMLDIFANSAFSVINLTDAINQIEFQPGRIAELGIFTESSVSTLAIAIEQKADVLTLVAPSPRGGPGDTVDKSKRNLRALYVPHFQRDDAIMADEVQGVRAWGSETEVMQVMEKVLERANLHSASMDVTEEQARLGAVKGVITYSDNSTLDLFAEFGVTQAPEVDFNLDATTDTGAVRQVCAAVGRTIANNALGMPIASLHSFCGDNFFDAMLQNVEVRNSYKGWTDAQILRQGYISPNGKIYAAFEFGGIVWENYRGSTGGAAFVDPDKCHIFPIGSPGLFKTVYGPADYIDTVNKPGQRRYLNQFVMENNKGVNIEVQTNMLHYCARPKVLIKGKKT